MTVFVSVPLSTSRSESPAVRARKLDRPEPVGHEGALPQRVRLPRPLLEAKADRERRGFAASSGYGAHYILVFST